VKFACSPCNKLMNSTSIAYITSSRTLLNISPPPGIVTVMIRSWPDVTAGCPCGEVLWIYMRWRGTELDLCNGYHSHSSPIITQKLFCNIFTHSKMVFPHKIHSGNLITTGSVNSFHIIAAATEVTVFPRPISSSTSAPDISASQTHLLKMNHTAQMWCTRHFIRGRPGIEYLWPGTSSSVDRRIGWTFSSLTAF